MKPILVLLLVSFVIFTGCVPEYNSVEQCKECTSRCPYDAWLDSNTDLVFHGNMTVEEWNELPQLKEFQECYYKYCNHICESK